MANNKKFIEDDEGDGEDPLMASFADMMTLLLGFFMILYSMSYEDETKFYEFGKAISSSFSRSEKEQDETSVIDSKDYKREARAFQMLASILNLGETKKAVTQAESLYIEHLKAKTTKENVKQESKEIQALEGEIRQRLDNQSDVVLDITIPSEKLFFSGQSVLSSETKKKISNLATLLNKVDYGGILHVIGHTDSVPIHSDTTDNWLLSAQRARSVVKELIKNGVPENRVFISAKAGTDPLYPEYDNKGNLIKENLEKNRRIQIQIVRPR